MEHSKNDFTSGVVNHPTWAEKRSLMDLTICEVTDGWHWAILDKRRGLVGEGMCSSFSDARQTIEKEWAYRRTLSAHSLIDEQIEPATKKQC